MAASKKDVLSNIKEHGIVIDQITSQVDILIKIIKLLITARNNRKTIFTMGNGGSGSTASHFVSDLIKTAITKGNKRFKAISLVDNIPVVLAWANDTSFENIFVEQLTNYLSKGDVVIAFSGSGKSKNVVKAMSYAKKQGAICIGITGQSGGLLRKICDVCLMIPSKNMLVLESAHLILCHSIISVIRNMGKPLFKYE